MSKSHSKFLPCEALKVNLKQNVRTHAEGKLKQTIGETTNYVSALDIDYDIPQMVDSILIAKGRIFSPIVVDGDKDNEVLQGNRRTLAAHTIKGKLESEAWKDMKITDGKPGGKDGDFFIRSLTEEERKETLDNLKRVPVVVFTGLTDQEKHDLINDHDQKPLSRSESAGAIFKALLEKPGMSLRELYGTYYRQIAALTGNPEKVQQASRITNPEKRHEFLVKWLNSKVSVIKQCFALGPVFVRGYVLTLLKDERRFINPAKAADDHTLPLTDEEQKEWKELGFDVNDTTVKAFYAIKKKVYDKESPENDEKERQAAWDELVSKLTTPTLGDSPSAVEKPRTKKVFEDIIAGHGLDLKGTQKTPAVNVKRTLLYLSGKDKDGASKIDSSESVKELIRLESVNACIEKHLDQVRHDKELHHLLQVIATKGVAEVEEAFKPFLKGKAKAS